MGQKINHSTGSQGKNVLIFIPLLHEERHFCGLIANFEKITKKFPFVKVVLVTTERERLGGIRKEVDTIILAKNLKKEGFSHIHYPLINKTLAPQINFAVNKILKERAFDKTNTFFGFYNADSVTSPEVIDSLLTEFNKTPKKVIFQQSSCFTSNYHSFNGCFGPLVLTNAFRQTSWTFFHEIPRFLKGHFFSFSLVHCVTHGLFIRADVFSRLGGFPEDSFGEDLYFGFVARSLGYKIYPLLPLENSASPTRVSSLLRQKYTWFWGPLGYLYYWFRTIKKFKNKERIFYGIMFFQTLFGILDAFGWILSGFLFLIFIFSASIFGYLEFAVISIYFYFGILLFSSFKLYNILSPKKIFPKIKESDKFFIFCLYPFVVILHSFPPVVAIFKEFLLRLTKTEYFRPKTE